MKDFIKYILFYSLFLISFICMPQYNKIDSLITVLKTAKEDTNKVNTLNSLAANLYSVNADSTILLVQQAITLSNKINFKKGEAFAYTIIGLAYQVKGDNGKALKNHIAALKIYEGLDNNGGIVQCLGNIGNVYSEQADYPHALEYYFKTLQIAEKLGDKKRIVNQLGNIGIIYMYQSNYPKALDYYFRGLRLAEELGDKNKISIQLGNIGIVYADQTDYAKALEYYFKSLKIKEELGDKLGIAKRLGNIGVAYHGQAESITNLSEKNVLLNKALEYYFKAMKLDEELGHRRGIAIQFGNIGDIYYEKSDYLKALDYYFKALKLAEELGDNREIMISLASIGTAYTKTGSIDKAEKYLKHSLSIAVTLEDLLALKDAYQNLSELYFATGKYKLSLENYKKYISVRDSISNEENTKKQTQQEMQYQFDKQQLADSIQNTEALKQEKQHHDQEIQQQKTYTYGGVIGFLLMIIVAGVSFRAFKNKQNANKIISEQKHLVEEKQKEIVDSIHYAKRIQKALMPSDKYIEKHLSEQNNNKN